jgi:Fe-S cluster assembly protein SufD
MAMLSENQYLDLYQSSSRMIKKNSAEVLNAVRDAAFEDFRRLGFPSRKVERYKYTDMSAIFEPDYIYVSIIIQTSHPTNFFCH